MTIEQLLAERKVVESQLEQLKKQYDRIYYEVYLNAWREATPEEKVLEQQYQKKQTELDQLMASQIRSVVATGDEKLIEDYYYSIPQKNDELKILFFPYRNFRDGQMYDILNKYINSGFLNGTEPNPYVSSDDFDNAMALFGADGIKIEYLNSMLNVKESSKKSNGSLNMEQIDDHILKTIAGFSSQEIAVELFSSIFSLDNLDSKVRENLCEKFASLMEQYQEKRIRYDVEAIDGGIRMINFDSYYLINFQTLSKNLIPLSEENKKKIEDLSVENAERVKQKIKPKRVNKQEVIQSVLSKYNTNKQENNSDPGNINLSNDQILEQFIQEAFELMKSTDIERENFKKQNRDYIMIEKPYPFGKDPEAIAVYNRKMNIYEHPEIQYEVVQKAYESYHACLIKFREMTERHVKTIYSMNNPQEEMANYYHMIYPDYKNRGSLAYDNYLENYEAFLLPYLFENDKVKSKTITHDGISAAEHKKQLQASFNPHDIYLLTLSDIQDDSAKCEYFRCFYEPTLNVDDNRKYWAAIIATFNGDDFSLAAFNALAKKYNFSQEIYETYLNEREYFKTTLSKKRELTKRVGIDNFSEDDFLYKLYNTGIFSEEEIPSVVELWKKEREAIALGNVLPFQKSREELISILLANKKNNEPELVQVLSQSSALEPSEELKPVEVLAPVIPEILVEEPKPAEAVEQKPEIVANPVENEEVLNDDIQPQTEPVLTRRIVELPSPVRIMGKAQQDTVAPTADDYEKLIEQRIAEKEIENSLSETELRAQYYKKAQQAILEIMGPNNSDKSILEKAELVRTNPDVVYYKMKYGNIGNDYKTLGTNERHDAK